MTEPTKDSLNKLAAPSGEWLEKWRYHFTESSKAHALASTDKAKLYQPDRPAAIADEFLTAIYAEVWQEASTTSCPECHRHECTLDCHHEPCGTCAGRGHVTAIEYGKFCEELMRQGFAEARADERAKARRETLEEAVGACKQVSRERRAWDLHGVEAALECEERIANLADQLKEADGES